MDRTVEVKLSQSCHDGGVCCEDPSGPIWIHDQVTGEVIRIDAVPEEEPQVKNVKQNRLRSLGRRILAALA